MVSDYSHKSIGWSRGQQNDGRLRGSDDEDAPLPHRQETGFTQGTLDSGVTDETCRTGYTESTINPVNRPPLVPQLGLDPDRESTLPSPSPPHRQVKRELSPTQIFLIVISGTIGLGLFTDSGEILRIAGPAGLLLAFVVVGIGVTFVMAGVAEMITHWPIPGALVEFIKAFVDKDLGMVLGLAYWLAYAFTFGTLFSALLDLGKYWSWNNTWRLIVMGFLLPGLATIINVQSVKVYGYIESILGALKLLLVLGAFVTMCIINLGGGVAPKIGSKYINNGFKSDPRITTSPFIAFLVGIPIATYGFAGVEIIAVAALEAKSPRALNWPASYVAWIISAAYFLSVLGFCLNVSWQDPALPSISNRATGGTTTGASILIIAATNSGIPHLAGILNVCLIVTVFSAANTTLYVASRTLFGLCRDINPQGWGWRQSVCSIGTTHTKSYVPIRAVLLSLLPGVWFPWLHISGNDQSFQEIMSGTATVSIILVWAAQCLAFIRYRLWLSRHAGMLYARFEKYSAEKLASRDILSHIQPVPAGLGLLGCLTTVLAFSTASWWQWGKPSASSVLAAFLMPGLLVLSWVILKLASPDGNRSLFSLSVTLSDDFADLSDALTNLENMIQDKPPAEYQNLEQTIQQRRPGWEPSDSPRDVIGDDLGITEP